MRCMVCDLTWRGAFIKAPDVILPDSFALQLPGFSKSSRQCRAVWREGDIVKVEFEALA